jgi:hypothetical protein
MRVFVKELKTVQIFCSLMTANTRYLNVKPKLKLTHFDNVELF